MRNIVKLLFLVSIISCRQPSKGNIKIHSQSLENKWDTLDETNYLIQYPSKWEIVKGRKLPLNAFYSPKESTEDKFQENVNVLIQSLAEEPGVDLNKFSEISLEQIKTMLTNSNIEENKRIKNTTQEYQKMIYNGDQGIFHLKFEQYFFVSNGQAYVLTCTSEQDKFDNYKETGENILNSFKLK